MTGENALKEINEMLAELVKDPCQTTQNLVEILTAAKESLEAVPEYERRLQEIKANVKQAVEQLKDNRYWHAVKIVEDAVYAGNGGGDGIQE